MSGNENKQLCEANNDGRCESISDNSLQPESCFSDDCSEKLQVAVKETVSFDELVVEKFEAEGLIPSDHQESLNVFTTPQSEESTKTQNLQALGRRKHQTEIVTWEPLLVPTAVGGKVEVVTALKRVDSEFVNRIGGEVGKDLKLTPKLSNPYEKDSKVAAPQRVIKPSSYVNTKKGSNIKGYSHTTGRQDFKKDITLKKAAEINAQIGKAIAEKEAAILKEIEKAMKEASSIKNKTMMTAANHPPENQPLPIDSSKMKRTLKAHSEANVKKSVYYETKESENFPDVVVTEVRTQERAAKVSASPNNNKTGIIKIQTLSAPKPATAIGSKDVHEFGSKSKSEKRKLDIPALSPMEIKIQEKITEASASLNSNMISIIKNPMLSTSNTATTTFSKDSHESNSKPTINVHSDKEIVHNVNELKILEITGDTSPVDTKVEGRSVKTLNNTATGIIQNQTLPSSKSVTATVSKEMLGCNVSSSSTSVTKSKTQNKNTLLAVSGISGSIVTPSSVAVSLAKDVFGNVLCGPTTVITSTSAAAFTSSDPRTLNKVITVPVSNQQAFKEMSPSAPRFILLTPPTLGSGNLPLLTPIITTSAIPVLHSSIVSSPMIPKTSSVNSQTNKRNTENKFKKSRVSDVTILNHTDTTNIEGPDECISTKVSAVNSSLKDSQEKSSTLENKILTKSEVPLLNSSKSTVKPTSSYLTDKCIKNGVMQRRERISLTQSKSEPASHKTKRIEKVMTSNPVQLCEIPNEESDSNTQSDLRNAQISLSPKFDSNHENIDVDELMTDDVDQSLVDETRNDQNMDGTTILETKSNVTAREEKHRSKVLKSQKSISKSSRNSKDLGVTETLEQRLHRIEQLYHEIPPVKSRLSFTSDEFGKIRDCFRDSVCAVKEISKSFQTLIDDSVSSKQYVHSSSQTEPLEQNFESYQPLNSSWNESDVISDGTVCRLCSKMCDSGSAIFLFRKENRKLLLMLNKILPQISPIQEMDSLPQQICKACEDKLSVCHNIICQFLQADKDLRHVLHDENPSIVSNTSIYEDCDTIKTEKNSNKVASNITTFITSVPQLQKENNEAPDGNSEEISRGCTQSPVHEKRKSTSLHSERSYADGSLSSFKRRRSKSPSRSGPIRAVGPSTDSKSSACIDLSKLDPEFNDGFEVEWCLDEETIRSSMIPEEDLNSVLTGASPVALHVAVSGPNTVHTFSTKQSVQDCADVSPRTFHETADIQRKAKDSVGCETSENNAEDP